VHCDGTLCHGGGEGGVEGEETGRVAAFDKKCGTFFFLSLRPLM
jgi:hypothetical protein